MKMIIPCPFCGGRADTYQTEPMHSTWDEGWYIRCYNCSAELGCNVTHSGEIIGEFKSEDEAIAAWNKRVDIPDVRDTIQQYDWS